MWVVGDYGGFVWDVEEVFYGLIFEFFGEVNGLWVCGFCLVVLVVLESILCFFCVVECGVDWWLWSIGVFGVWCM